MAVDRGAYNSHNLESVRWMSDYSHNHRLLSSIAAKTRLSKIELATLFIPVLAITLGFDTELKTNVAVGTHVVSREYAVEKLNLDGSKPIGKQLFNNNVLNLEEAHLLDTNLFNNAGLHLVVRFDGIVENTDSILKSLAKCGLVDMVKTVYKKDGYTFAQFFTYLFMELTKFLAKELPHGAAVLLSLDDEVICI